MAAATYEGNLALLENLVTKRTEGEEKKAKKHTDPDFETEVIKALTKENKHRQILGVASRHRTISNLHKSIQGKMTVLTEGKA